MARAVGVLSVRQYLTRGSGMLRRQLAAPVGDTSVLALPAGLFAGASRVLGVAALGMLSPAVSLSRALCCISSSKRASASARGMPSKGVILESVSPQLGIMARGRSRCMAASSSLRELCVANSTYQTPLSWREAAFVVSTP